jgi:hypothetical protein
MRAVAHSPSFAKKVGVKQSVGKDFEMADKKKVRKFADGGSDRYKARMDRKTADIEKDYKVALAKGKNADVAKAKYEQRMADAKDDFAKWTKADRTVTRAGESAAEAALKEARRTNGRSIQMRDTLEKANKPLEPKIDVSSTLKGVNTTPLAKKAAAPAAKASAPKAPASTSKGYSSAANEVTREKNRADMRKRTSAATRLVTGSSTPASTPAATTSAGSRDNTAAGRRARMGEALSGIFGAPGRLATSIYTGNWGGKPEAKATAPKPDAAKAARLAQLKKAAEAPGASRYAKDQYKFAQESNMYKKGGNVKKYAKGGNIPPQPTAAEKAEADRQRNALRKVKVTPKEGKVIQSANRSEGSGGMKKGGMTKKFAKGGVTKEMPSSNQMGSMNMAKGGSAKAGRALVKKSADTMGRAMVKKFAKGGSIDGCAIRGKTRAPMRKGK